MVSFFDVKNRLIELLSLQEGNILCIVIETQLYMASFGKVLSMLNFIYSEKATKFCKISTVPVKYMVEILQNCGLLRIYELYRMKFLDKIYIMSIHQNSRSKSELILRWNAY